jgi:mono/diheme cytochrome c family protein
MVGIRLELIGRCVLGLVLCSATLSACGAGDNATPTSSTTAPAIAGTTVQVSVTARDTVGDTLHYRWAATEGTINNVDAPSTTWTIPPGSGLQFAYVLVSDNNGGYTESRAAALTQTAVSPQSQPSSGPPGDSGKGFIWGTLYYEGFGRQVYLPDWDVQVTGASGTFTTTTDKKGEFFFPGLTVAAPYSFSYKVPGQISFTPGQSIPTSAIPTSPSASTYSRQKVTLAGTLLIAGSVRMADNSYCGIRDEFFTGIPIGPGQQPLDTPVSGTAELLDQNNNTVGTPSSRPRATVNHYGDYLIVLNQLASAPVGPKVRIRCESLIDDRSVNLTAPLSGQQNGPSFTLPNARPVVDNMTVTLGGQNIGRPDLPAPTVLKSIPEMDLAPGDDAFLTFKGIDTRKGACAYYHKIGAVEGCDNAGFPTGKQLTLDQWKQNFNLSPFHNGDPAEPEYKAIYMNKFDLNFARDMQGLKRTNGDLAYNVCNYPGPQNVNDPLGAPRTIGDETEADINLSIENARRGIGMIACVAMDYSVTPGLNGGQPFTKFYTFGPTGKLLLSISLDGRREKFIPGSCTACHGGDFYGGKFPDNYARTVGNPTDTGAGRANIESYFLPFDVGNFKFSTQTAGLKRADLLPAFFKLNTLLQGTTGNPKAVSDDVSALITQWYAGPLAPPEHNSIAPPAYDPSIVVNALGQSQQQSCGACHAYNAVSLYKEVVGPSCQTCHSSNAIVPDSQAGGSPRMTFFQRPPSHYLKPPVIGISGAHTVCGGSSDLKMNHMMPNTLATFERFWLSREPGKGPNQIDRLFSFSGVGTACSGTKPLEHKAL